MRAAPSPTTRKRMPRALSACSRRRSGSVRAKSGTVQAEAEALGWRALQVAKRVIEVRDVVLRVLRGEMVRAAPECFGVTQPLLLFRRERVRQGSSAIHVVIVSPRC